MAVEARSNRYTPRRACGQLRLGEADRGVAEHQVGHGRAEQRIGVGVGAGTAVGVEDVVDAVGRDEPGDAAPQPFVVERPGDAGRTWKRFHSSAVVPATSGTAAALPARIASSGRPGQHLAADDGLEGERPDRHAAVAADLLVERGVDLGLGAEEFGDGRLEQGVGRRGAPRAPTNASVTRSAVSGGGRARWRRSGRSPGGTARPRPASPAACRRSCRPPTRRRS